MPVIRVSDSTFAHLKTISTWLEGGTPSQTIDLLVGKTLEELNLEKDEMPSELNQIDLGGVIKFRETPALSFTRVTKAFVDGRPIFKPNWGNVLLSTIKILQKKGLSKSKLTSELCINSKAGEYDEHGYKFVSDLGISVQGQSAPDAWKEASRLAKKWGIDLEVEFQWGVNPKGLFPNRIGSMKVSG